MVNFMMLQVYLI